MIVKGAMVASLMALGACNNTPAEKAADNVEAVSENQADVLEDKADNAATENQADALENKADAVRDAGDNKADAVRAAGDNKADAMANGQ
jgi:hypothetical protein